MYTSGEQFREAEPFSRSVAAVCFWELLPDVAQDKKKEPSGFRHNKLAEEVCAHGIRSSEILNRQCIPLQLAVMEDLSWSNFKGAARRYVYKGRSLPEIACRR